MTPGGDLSRHLWQFHIERARMFDRVFLTGSNGLIGRATVQRLVQQVGAVRGVDLQDASSISGIEYQSCDVRDFEQVREAIVGCDAVVHLAALPSPRFGDGPTTFDINATGTYNVFEAAAQEGIKRVVQASSMNAVGCTWNLGDFVPDYFPVDEDQSTAISDPYSLSKHISETVGEYFWRRDGISGVALRMPAVLPEGEIDSEGFAARRKRSRAFLDEFRTRPTTEQRRLLAAVRKRVLEFRVDRGLEYGTEQPQPTEDDLGEIPKELWEQYMWQRFMLWTVVDVRDTAQAFVRSLEAEYTGAHPLWITDRVNSLGYDVRVLADLFFPKVTEWREDLRGADGLVSIHRARELIGYHPEYSVADVLG